jgi:hypothetical protein
VVSDYFKLKIVFIETAEKALTVIKWFNSHSRALGILGKQQKDTYNKVLALILPVITRWTCHYLSFTQLIKISKPMRTVVLNRQDTLKECAGKKRDALDAAEKVLQIVEEPKFWEDILRCVFKALHLF